MRVVRAAQISQGHSALHQSSEKIDICLRDLANNRKSVRELAQILLLGNGNARDELK
jgi:hypothetical protein